MVAILFAPLQALSARHSHRHLSPQQAASALPPAAEVHKTEQQGCGHGEQAGTTVPATDMHHAGAGHDMASCNCATDCSCHCNLDVLHPALTSLRAESVVMVGQVPRPAYTSFSPIVLPVENPPPLAVAA